VTSLLYLKLIAIAAVAAIGQGCAEGDAPIPTRLIGFEKDLSLNAEGIWEREVDAGMQWNEAIISWNAEVEPEGKVTIYAAPGDADHWFTLGIWTPAKETRKSVNEQKNDHGEVKTDLLATPTKHQKLRIRIVADKAKLDLITVSFSDRTAESPDLPAMQGVWGTVLEPPRRFQMDYKDGNVICSATSTSMLLGYWAQRLGRSEIDRDVPVVCEGVFDPEWPGTGNWPFNTAYAGSIPGMRGYVTRLWGIPQLEAWIARGVPVACSVSRMLLRGEPQGKNDGHIVVLVGFTNDGDPVFNDPGRGVVRITYKRADFDAAWASSGRTTYIIHPDAHMPPENKDLCWLEKPE